MKERRAAGGKQRVQAVIAWGELVAQNERVAVRDLILLILGVVPAMIVGGVNAHAVKPPEQPRTGPGGAEYAHGEVRESVHGEGGEQFWLFQPAAPVREKAPLILFLHGYSAMEPHGYRGWIDHLVRRGNIVVYPRYQANLLTPAVDFHVNTLTAMKAALAVLKEKGNTEPDLGSFAAVGHSAGGVGAVNYAAGAREAGLPEPKAVVVVQPGQGPRRGVPLVPLLLEKGLPAALRLIVAVGDADTMAGDISARRIWRQTAELRERAYVTVQSDIHGVPGLRAGHLSPLAMEREMADALDWYGWWRLFDVACASAFSNEPLKLDPAMGKWSDGQPLKPLKIEYPD